MKIKKLWILYILSLFILISCEAQTQFFKQKWQDFQENFTESVKIFLTRVPVVKNYIKLPPPPKELYEELQSILFQLEAYRAKDLYPEEYAQVFEEWLKIQKLYQEKYYLKAQKLLKKTLPLAKNLLEKIQKYYSNLKNSALKRYQEVEKLAQEKLKKSSPENRLKIQLYLWRLKNLLILEKYEEFNKELEKRPF